MSGVGGGGGWWGVGGLLGDNCGTSVQASISKPTCPLKDLFIYLIIRNVDLFIYCPLIFCTHLLLVVRQIQQSVHKIPREHAASKTL